MVYYDKEAGAPSPAAGELSRCVLPKRNGVYLFTCGGLAAFSGLVSGQTGGPVANARPGNESAAAFSCPNDICGGQRRGRRARVDRATSRYCRRARTRPSGSSRRGRVDAWLTRFTRRRRRKERIPRNYPELQNGGSGNFPEFRLLFPNVMKLEPNNSFQM